MARKQVQISVPEELVAELDRRAASAGMSRSEYVLSRSLALEGDEVARAARRAAKAARKKLEGALRDLDELG